MLRNIAVFASGGGSNAQKLMEYFKDSEKAKVVLLVGNKKEMGAYEKAKDFGVQTMIIDRTTFYESDLLPQLLKKANVDLIVLAGFLWLIPSALIKAFPNKIVNIHPSLLPKYGGKGMFGHHVHEAVHAAQEKESGMTIHYVNEKFDEGEIIFQDKCDINAADTPETIAQKVLLLEHRNYAPVIDNLIQKMQ
ncbi:MAG: phosphoribosylglycinamide formyltransferase [Saprospiraceae bacterium]